MPKRLLSNLTWKAGVAAAAFALAAGTGATTIAFANASDHKPETPAVTTTTTDHVPNDHADDNATSDTHGTEDDTSTTAASTTSQDHPDNFGKTVSEDAKDGGVDGQQISDMAHAKNDARKNASTNASTAGDDHKVDGEDQADDANDDHEVDGQTKADDANGDHGTTSTTADDDGSDD